MGRTTDQLMSIATCAKSKGAIIVINNANSKTTEQLMSIATCGGNGVIFDLTEN